MELPVFQENLRSSASWTVDLEKAIAEWHAASDSARDRAREMQVEHTVNRLRNDVSGSVEGVRGGAHLISIWSASPLTLNLESLKDLHASLSSRESGASEFRSGEATRLGEYHDPAPAVILPRLVENALDWFQTPSFGEIHPVEQAAIAHLRLLDLQPFDSLNDEVATLTASFYTEKAGLPPLVLFADDNAVKQYQEALEAAFRMLTQPLVELISQSLVRTVKLALV